MISKFSMFENLKQLQAHGSLTDTCLVGDSGKVFIHRAMLFADHVQPDPVWYQLDPGEGDGKMVVVVPDADATRIIATIVLYHQFAILELISKMLCDSVFQTLSWCVIHMRLGLLQSLFYIISLQSWS